MADSGGVLLLLRCQQVAAFVARLLELNQRPLEPRRWFRCSHCRYRPEWSKLSNYVMPWPNMSTRWKQAVWLASKRRCNTRN